MSTLFRPDGIIHKDTYNDVRMVHFIFGDNMLWLKNGIRFLSLKIDFVLVNSADHDGMRHFIWAGSSMFV